jgi:hypothetical protein
MSLPKMRTAPQLAAEYRAVDPHTHVNAHFIRQLLITGAIPFVPAGKKHLINADLFAEYLRTGQISELRPENKAQWGQIRMINEK